MSCRFSHWSNVPTRNLARLATTSSRSRWSRTRPRRGGCSPTVRAPRSVTRHSSGECLPEWFGRLVPGHRDFGEHTVAEGTQLASGVRIPATSICSLSLMPSSASRTASWRRSRTWQTTRSGRSSTPQRLKSRGSMDASYGPGEKPSQGNPPYWAECPTGNTMPGIAAGDGEPRLALIMLSAEPDVPAAYRRQRARRRAPG